MLQKMKKTQRSYSSFRAKTQQAQIIDNSESSWIASNNGQKVLRNLNHKISTSQLMNDMHSQGLFQSVSERVFQPKRGQNHYSSCVDANMQDTSQYLQERKSLTNESASQASKSQKVISHLRQKCKNYEKALQFFNKQRQNVSFNKQNIKHSNNFNSFNYSQQYYVKEVQDLRRLVLQKETQLQKYRNLYNSKTTQVQGISTQISLRMQKQTNQKNLYIKQLNMRNIQAKKLTQKLQLFQSQLQTKQFVIKQKDQQLQQLNKQLQGYSSKKVKIQTYEQRILETQEKLKEIQQYTVRLRGEVDQKEQMYLSKNYQLGRMMGNIEEYQQKLKLIENSFVQELDKNKRLKANEEDIREQYQKIKQEYLKITPLKQIVKQKQAQLKNLQLISEDLKTKSNQMTLQNQQLRQELEVKEKSSLRIQHYELQIDELKKMLRQKDETIYSQNSTIQQLNRLQQKQKVFAQQHPKLKQSCLSKQKLILSLENQLASLQSQSNKVSEQLQRRQAEAQKGRQRKSKIDQMYKQNQKLNSNIHQKLNQIQKLQQRITNLENKVCNLTNDNSKLKSARDQASSQLLKAQNSVQELTDQVHRQTYIKQKLQQQLASQGQQLQYQNQQLLRTQHECTAYKATVNQFEEQNVSLNNQLEQHMQQDRQQIQQDRQHIQFLEQRLQQYVQQRQNSETIMTQANQKISDFNQQLQDCKSNIQELVNKQRAHRQLVKNVQLELKRVQAEKNVVIQEKEKLSRAIDKIYSISAQVKPQF